jgi:hypothetical protein
MLASARRKSTSRADRIPLPGAADSRPESRPDRQLSPHLCGGGCLPAVSPPPADAPRQVEAPPRLGDLTS